jgi:hypothetical protein
MTNVSDVCKEVVDGVDGALACSVVDLATGLLLGVHHSIPYFTQSYLDAVAAAAVDMFRGKGVKSVEKLLSQVRGEKIENTFKEVQVSTSNTFHFMAIIPDKPNSLVVLVTKNTTNLGMGWSAVRGAMGKLGPLCP